MAVDRNDSKQPYSRTITSASNGSAMVAKAAKMTTKVHPRKSSGYKKQSGMKGC